MCVAHLRTGGRLGINTRVGVSCVSCYNISFAGHTSWTRDTDESCFLLTADMSFLLTPSAAIWTRGPLATTFQHLEQSASSPERFIQPLGEFIFTALQTSTESFEAAQLVSSMWTVGTRTLCLLVALQRKVTITQSRMETLRREGLVGQNHAEVCLGDLMLSATLRTSVRIQRSFLSYTTRWIEVASLPGSTMCAPTQTGVFDQSQWSTPPPTALSFEVERLMEEMTGWYSLELEMSCHL
nr:replication-associated protein A [Faeces associated gemycircularvirus 6]